MAIIFGGVWLRDEPELIKIRSASLIEFLKSHPSAHPEILIKLEVRDIDFIHREKRAKTYKNIKKNKTLQVH